MIRTEDCKNYFDYLKKSFKATPFGSRFTKIAGFFRKSLLVTRVLRAIWLALSYIQTGAFFIISFSFLLILLPALLLFAAIVFLFNIFKYKKTNAFFKEQLKDKECVVYFVNEDTVLPEKREDEIRITVHTSRFFVLKKREKDDYHIGIRYYFSLRKNVLSSLENVSCTDLRDTDNTAERPL